MTADNYADKLDITEAEKIDQFSAALESMSEKKKNGELNIIDQRLIDLLTIYNV